MEVEIVSIGNEILRGHTINTNATFISDQLSARGYRVVRHTVIEDSPAAIKEAFTAALDKGYLVIVTGGLGATCDDITRDTVAAFFDSPLKFEAEVAAELKKRFGSSLTSIKDQATLPEKAVKIKNRIGTAQGLLFYAQSSGVILLPGVPVEMKTMLVEEVLPLIITCFPPTEPQFHQTLHFFHLYESQIDPLLRELVIQYPEIQFGIYPAPGIVSVSLSTSANQPEEGLKKLEAPLEKLKLAFGRYSFQGERGKIEEAVQATFIERRLTLSCAESCSGGVLAAKLTHLPGASSYFLGGVVSYSNALKTNILGIPAALIEAHGAVSEEVVKAMAAGMQRLSNSDYALAISGVAGPNGGTTGKPVGTVWCGISHRDQEPTAFLLNARGTRETIIEKSCHSILGELLMQVRELEH